MNEQHPDLNPEQKERYSRHLLIPGFDSSSQKKLENASVLVVGMGGLGCPTALYLSAAGIGTLGVADFDVVEKHNLQRQVLFGESDIGRAKAEVAKERLEQMYATISVAVHSEGVLPKNVQEIIAKYDVIVDGTDNFGTRYLLNDACFLGGKPLVSGSVYQLEGQVWVLNPGEQGPCYRCIFPEAPAAGLIANCNEAGVIGAACGIVGSLQAMEVMKLLTGLGKPLMGQLLKMDGLANRFSTIRVERDVNCALCGENRTIHDLNSQNYLIPCGVSQTGNQTETGVQELGMEIDVESAKKLMAEENALPLDVREIDEAQICQIKNSRFIPMGDIPNQLNSLPKDRPIIVYCHHGFRSLRVVLHMRSMGYENCTSMRGGINHWASVIEPDMARY